MKQFEDYGCPDWRDADGYGDFELWDDVNWRWQFKRRWRDYRIVFGNLCYQNHLECYPDRPIPVFPMWMPEYRDAYFFASPAQAARFDFPRLFNPLNANLPDHQWDALRDATTRFERRTVTAADFINNKDTKHKPRDVFGSGSIAITFNLYSPIRAQLDGLEDYLKEQQHYTAHKDIQRHHRDKWLLYLRVLDAREANATWAECTTILPETMAHTEQAARDVHKQAVQLQERL